MSTGYPILKTRSGIPCRMDGLLHQIRFLEESLRQARDPLERERLEKMLSFRQLPDTLDLMLQLESRYPAGYIERATAMSKQVNRQYEKVHLHMTWKTPGELFLAHVPAASRLFASLSPILSICRQSMNGRGIVGGCATDLCYQSQCLFPEYPATFSGWFSRSSPTMTDLRNRYRRVLDLTLSRERINCFQKLVKAGAITPSTPLLIASFGGGPGSIEMDIQQVLRERHRIPARIVIFDVNRDNYSMGSFFAKMRGADILWVIQEAGKNDLLTREKQGSLDAWAMEPLIGTDPWGEAVRITPHARDAFGHIIMSGFWEYFDDDDVAAWLRIYRVLMAPAETAAVITLMRNTCTGYLGRQHVIPSVRILDNCGRSRIFYRSLEDLKRSCILNKAGFEIIDSRDGAIFPVLSLRSVQGDI